MASGLVENAPPVTLTLDDLLEVFAVKRKHPKHPKSRTGVESVVD